MTQIISGGQTGADQGALVAAKQLGIKTGRWISKGFLTESGSCPALGALYNLKEHSSASYPPRTYANARDSDATVWISGEADVDSRGFRCTEKACDYYERPFFKNPSPELMREWVNTFNIKVLNVAGPRASRDPMAHRRAAEFILETFCESR